VVDGTKIRVAAKGHERPGSGTTNGTETRGDVIVAVNVRDHARFQRKGVDLYTSQEISLLEALCGYTITIPHISGKAIQITSDVIRKPESTQKMEGHGITTTGSLYVKYHVKFPQTPFNAADRQTLCTLLA
jgi:DnaJ family protein A protein 2